MDVLSCSKITGQMTVSQNKRLAGNAQRAFYNFSSLKIRSPRRDEIQLPPSTDSSTKFFAREICV